MNHQYRRVCCTHCGYHIDVPIYCGNRFCSVCSGPRLKRVKLRLTTLISKAPFVSGHDFKHLTLTIQNRQDLPGMITHLIKSFKALRRTQFWKHHVYGGAFVIEVTGEPGSWHAHIHSILQCTWIKYESLLTIWMHISRGRGVFITRIPKTQCVKYLTKYLSKCSVSEQDISDIAPTLASYRLFQTFGKWHSIKTSFPKQPYPCPKCKVCAWLPFDILHADLISRYGSFTPP